MNQLEKKNWKKKVVGELNNKTKTKNLNMRITIIDK